MARTTNTKAVASKGAASNAVAVVDYGQYAGAGFENMGREDFAVPLTSKKS